ncbi:MAG: Lpp/OprI family alanine-zipper lipoprotein [Halorhodospira sp.]
MSNRFASTLKLAAVGTALGLISACATVDEEEVASVVDREVDDLYVEMDELRSQSNEALETAEGADSTATEAHEIAEEALRKSEDNEEKIDRMFERTMEK